MLRPSVLKLKVLGNQSMSRAARMLQLRRVRTVTTNAQEDNAKVAKETTVTPAQVQFSSFMPPEARDFKYARHLVLAVDGTKASEDAARWVIKNLVRSGDLLHLIHVAVPESFSTLYYTGPPGSEITRANWEMQEKMMEKCVEKTELMLEKTISDIMPDDANGGEDMTPFRPPIELDCILDFSWDPIGSTLLRKTKAVNAACLIVVKHSKNWAQKLLSGSVSDWLINNADDIPVLVWHARMPTEEDLLKYDEEDESNENIAHEDEEGDDEGAEDVEDQYRSTR
jgi:nucleotide-binding universal stress UspA family protein